MEMASSVPLLLRMPMSIEDLLAFILGVLFAVTLNAEAQAFVATTMGDRQEKSSQRFHFNPLRHLDLLGTAAFLLGGFGWARRVEIDPGRLTHPRLYTILIRAAGPCANLFVASIGGSIVMLAHAAQFHAGLVPGVIAVNVTVAVYNLLPIPPLAAGSLWTVWLGESASRRLGYICGAMLVVVLALARAAHLDLFGRYFNPVILPVFRFIMGEG